MGPLYANVPRKNEDARSGDQERRDHYAQDNRGDGGPATNDTMDQQHDGERDHRGQGDPSAELSQGMTRLETRAGGSEGVRLGIRPSLTGDGADDTQVAKEDQTRRDAEDRTRRPNVNLSSRLGGRPHDDRKQEGHRERRGGRP